MVAAARDPSEDFVIRAEAKQLQDLRTGDRARATIAGEGRREVVTERRTVRQLKEQDQPVVGVHVRLHADVLTEGVVELLGVVLGCVARGVFTTVDIGVRLGTHRNRHVALPLRHMASDCVKELIYYSIISLKKQCLRGG